MLGNTLCASHVNIFLNTATFDFYNIMRTYFWDESRIYYYYLHPFVESYSF